MAGLKQYPSTIEGYNKLSEDNLPLLDISREIVMDYVFPKSAKTDVKLVERSDEDRFNEAIKYCGIKSDNLSSKEEIAYNVIYKSLIKDIKSIDYDPMFGIMDEVVDVANACLKARHNVIKFRIANTRKKLLF